MPSNAEVKAPPRPAATVMLLREAGDGVEVLITRRHERLAVMGGLWVFPGGTLHASDTSPRMQARIADRPQGRQDFGTLDGPALPIEACLGLAVAACRETFEETGLLLAVGADGRPCSTATCERLQAERSLVAAQPEHFATVLEREQLLLDIDALVYWAHWITPSSASRRFDTRFFAVAAAADQAVSADSTETMECRWLSPAEIIALADRGAMPLSPPTLFNLIDLRESYRRHRSLQALLQEQMQRRVPPILPKMLDEASQTTVVMPWDAGYASLAGESAPAHIEYPALLRSQPSRVTWPRRGG